MAGADRLLAMAAETLVSDQLNDLRTNDGQLLYVLHNGPTLPQRPLAIRAVLQLPLDFFIDVIGNAPMSARMTLGPTRLLGLGLTLLVGDAKGAGLAGCALL